MNYEMAIEETKKALNELNSIIYNLPLNKICYNKLKDSIKILHSLLNKHISDMAVIFKNENKMGEMSIDKRPDSFYDMYFKINEDDLTLKL